MNNSNIKFLLKYLEKHILHLIVVLFSLFVVSVSILLIGFVFRRLIDLGIGEKNFLQINNSIYFIIFLVCIFSLASFFRSYFINIISLNVTSKIKLDTYKNLLKADIARFEDLKIGDIVSRLDSDVEMVGNIITNFLSFFVRNSIMLLGSIVLMFMQSFKLSLLVIIAIPVMLAPLLKLSKYVRNLSRVVLKNQGMLASDIEENFSAIRTLYAYNKQRFTIDVFAKKTDLYLKQASKRLKIRSLFFAMAICLIASSIIFVIWVGSIDILHGNVTSGEIMAFIYYAVIAGMSMGGIAELFSEIQAPLAALERVVDLKNIPASFDNYQDDNEKFEINNQRIEFQNVTFSYPSRPDIFALNNISLLFDHGKFTGIVGRSGSGKSSLMQLLLKFYLQQSGKIFVGGQDIHKICSNQLRTKIAYVEQNPTIFSGTIRENISFSKPGATDIEIENLAKICGILDFTKDLKLGLDTEIGERGIRISGGQKQRIAIARAILYDAEILLLDEATSALDNESEKIILHNILHQMHNKTVISIAHRISSIEKADNIMVINQGKLIAQGTHEHLLSNSKLYNLLCKEQR